MKIRCRREKFAPLFTLVSSFTAVRDVRPTLTNVKMTADEKSVVLTASDGEISAQGEASVEDGFVVEYPGEAILPAKLLRKILSETNDEEFTIELTDGKLVVRGANVGYALATQSGDDFPVVPPFDAAAYHKISTKALGETIRRTAFATDAENPHYALGGVWINFEADRITAVSTDGRRLAVQTRPAEAVGGHAPTRETIFPLRVLNLIERASNGCEETLIAVDESRATIKFGNVVVSTVFKEGRFPNWKRIMPPKEGKIKVDFIAGQLATAVRQAEIVATEKRPGVWLRFEKGKVKVEAEGEEVGESSIDVPVAYDDEPASLRLDPRFLNEFFREISPDDTISLYFKDDAPATFETTDDYSYVVMPLT